MSDVACISDGSLSAHLKDFLLATLLFLLDLAQAHSLEDVVVKIFLTELR